MVSVFSEIQIFIPVHPSIRLQISRQIFNAYLMTDFRRSEGPSSTQGQSMGDHTTEQSSGESNKPLHAGTYLKI